MSDLVIDKASLSTEIASGHSSTTRPVLLPWLLAAVSLVTVFLYCNTKIVTGAEPPTWDAWIFYSPEFSLVADHARAGRLLLWDPWVGGGAPDHAEPQIGAASPVTILAGALTGGGESSFRVYWLLLWILGPVGMLLFARYLGTPPWAAFVVALAFAFCGFYTGHAEHTTFVYSLSSLPIIFWRFDVTLETLRLRHAAETGALWGLSALGGYPAFTILTGLFLLIWALGRCFWSPTDDLMAFTNRAPKVRLGFSAIALATIVAVGVLVLAPTYFAFFTQGVGYSERAGGLSRQSAGAGALAPGALLNFASPYIATLKWPLWNLRTLWPGTDVALTGLYVGAWPLILAVLAVVQRPKSGWRWWLAGTTTFALMCALGNNFPVRGWVYDYCPPTRYFRHAASFRAYAIFAVMILALLAARDIQTAISRRDSRTWVKLLCVAIVTSTAAIASYISVIHEVRILGDQFHRANRHLLWMWLGSVGISVIVLLLPKARRWLPYMLVIFAVIDAAFTIRLSQKIVTSSAESRPLWNRIYQNHKTSLDLTPNGLARDLRPPAWMGLNLENNNIVARIPTLYNDIAMSNRFYTGFEKHPVLANMAVGSERIWFARGVATVIPTDATYNALVQRSEALGTPVLVVHPPQAMGGESYSGLAVTQATGKTPLDLAEDSAIAQLPAAQKIHADIVHYTPNHLRLTVFCPSDGWLLVTDRWASGWRAKVNDHQAEIFGGNFVYRAVRVTGGENRIDFDYQQTGYLLLVALSWSTLAGVFLGPRFSRAIGRYSRGFSGC